MHMQRKQRMVVRVGGGHLHLLYLLPQSATIAIAITIPAARFVKEHL
jgi:hypothetical protein